MTPVEEPAAAPPTPQGPTSPKVSSTIPRRPNLESVQGLWSPRLLGGGHCWVGPSCPIHSWRDEDEALGARVGLRLEKMEGLGTMGK